MRLSTTLVGILLLSCVAAVAEEAGDALTPCGDGPLVVDLSPDHEGYYRPLAFRNDEWYGSTFWSGPDWTRVGRNWHHPGNQTPSVRRFDVPVDGRVRVSGRVHKADTNNGGGDGIRAEIRVNENVVWSGEIDGGDTEGLETPAEFDAYKGDVVRFLVHKRGAIPYDTTYWDPTVVVGDGTVYVGSEGFTEGTQGDGPWGYEMEIATAAGDASPRVYALTKSLFLERTELKADGAPVVLSGARYLPVVVVASGDDARGVLLVGAVQGPNWQCTIEPVARPEGGAKVFRPRYTVSRERLDMAVEHYEGGWGQAFAELDALLDASGTNARLAALHIALENAFRAQADASGIATPRLPLQLWCQVQDEWLRQDGYPASPRALTKAAGDHLVRALSVVLDSCVLTGEDQAGAVDVLDGLRRLRAETKTAPGSPMRAQALYVAARRLKRELMLQRPEFDFDRLLFCKRVPTSYSHLVMQYYGWRARAGGGLFVLDNPGYACNARDILDGRLETGSVLEPHLHWDGERIVFSYVENAGRDFDIGALNNTVDDGFYHLWSVRTDGAELTQLTSGPYDDLMPTWLPDGGIAFCSTRRRGYARCFGAQFSPRWDTYTLHRVEANGQDLVTLSFNDVSEWFPTVGNDGFILYSRWDYIDRDAVTHQNLWRTRPDGTNPSAVWGNGLPSPHCTFQMEPIPNSDKILFVASAHHSITGGSLVLLDPRKGEDAVSAIRRITPQVPFPEAETRDIKEWYASPWPLAEDLYLTAYCPRPLVWEPGANPRDALGLYLLDDAGNQELIYRDPDIGATNPVPLRARAMPPVIPSNCEPGLEDEAVFYVADVYDGLKDVVPRGEIKALRVVQIFPKSTPVANNPRIGLAGEENGRAILGTVPVEPDGSAYFRAPARKALLFQLLDSDGCAVQVMRSLTYAQPGERVSCVGCHEGRLKAAEGGLKQAMERAPSAIEPGPLEGEPFSYARVVQPVLDAHCVKCHDNDDPPKGVNLTASPHKGFTQSYWALCGGVDFGGHGTNPENAAKALVPRFGQRNQIQVTEPGGMYGARGSRLFGMLKKGHKKVKLSPDELARVASWIDSNAIFYGVNEPDNQAKQLAGEPVPMPDVQ